MSSSKKFDPVNKQLDFLLKNDIWADKYKSFTRGPAHGIKRILHRWEISQSTLQTTISSVNYTDLKYAARHKALLSYDNSQITSFKSIPSVNNHHQVLDHHNNILVYRFRLPAPLVTTLTDCYSLLPQRSTPPTVRGDYTHDHYALWADYSKKIYYSSEYTRDLPSSQQFLNTNEPLFNYLSDNLRLISPHMYLKLTSLEPFLPAHLNRLGGAWSGVAVNRGYRAGTSSLTHYDWQDYPASYNCVVPTSHDPTTTYTGANLVLWPLKVVMELKPGDALFFFGSLIAYNVTPVSAGLRNSLDLFTHKSCLDWKKRQVLKQGKKHH